MYFATSMSDLQLIVNSNCGDPHRILGMHEENIGGKDCVVVRVFNPEAKSVKVIDDKKELHMIWRKSTNMDFLNV